MEHNNDFVPVSDDYGNELCIYADDFPILVNKPRGTEVCFVIRGAIKGVRDYKETCMPVGQHEKLRSKVEVYIWEAKLESVEDTKEKPDMSKIEKALGGSGRQVNSQTQNTQYTKDGE